MITKIKYTHTLHTHNPQSAMLILKYVFKILNTSSVLDVGCGNGSWLKAAKELGIGEVFGIDGITAIHKEGFISQDEFMEHDLTKPLVLNKKYDLVISLEVAEHLPETAAETFINILTNHGHVVLFSAAIPGQGGQNHLNEQWPQYWNEKFKERGYLAYDILRKEFWNNEQVLWWYKQNMVLYIKENTKLLNQYESVDEVLPLIHPSLYLKKEFKPRYLHSKSEILKSLKNHLKYLFKY